MEINLIDSFVFNITYENQLGYFETQSLSEIQCGVVTRTLSMFWPTKSEFLYIFLQRVYEKSFFNDSRRCIVRIAETIQGISA